MRWWKDKRQECLYKNRTAQRRHRGGNDGGYAKAETRMAEHSKIGSCEVENTPCIEGNAGERRRICKGNARKKVQEQED